MPTKLRLPDSTIAEIIAAYNDCSGGPPFPSGNELAKQYGVSHSYMYRLLRKYTSIRPEHESKKARLKGKLRSPEHLKPPPLCACGCGQTCTWQRPIWSKYASGHYRTVADYKNKEWLTQQYIVQKRSTYAIAAEFGVSANTIQKFLKKFNLPRYKGPETRRSYVGEGNPAWEGGISKLNTALYFNNLWAITAATIYMRDNYSCARCHKHSTDKYVMHAHHIHPWHHDNDQREFTDPSNLITLCLQCHRWVHSKLNIERLFLR